MYTLLDVVYNPASCSFSPSDFFSNFFLGVSRSSPDFNATIRDCSCTREMVINFAVCLMGICSDTIWYFYGQISISNKCLMALSLDWRDLILPRPLLGFFLSDRHKLYYGNGNASRFRKSPSAYNEETQKHYVKVKTAGKYPIWVLKIKPNSTLTPLGIQLFEFLFIFFIYICYNRELTTLLNNLHGQLWVTFCDITYWIYFFH